MTSDTNHPAERSSALELSPAERKGLRAVAHHLDPVVTIGDAGLSTSVLAEVERALDAHGLVKIRVHGDDRVRREELLTETCERLRCAPVQMIGKLFVVWRPKRQTGTGGNAGTSRRRPPRQTKKIAGARKETDPSKSGSAARTPSRARSSTTSARPGAAQAGPDAGPKRPDPVPARPGTGTKRGDADPAPASSRARPAPAPWRARPATAGASPARKSPSFKPTGTPRARPAGSVPGASGSARPITRSARPGSGTPGRRKAR